MRKTTTTLWGAALSGFAVFGCAAHGTPGRAGADLAYVEESTIEGRSDLYIDPTVSWRPMTMAELGDSTAAIPVEVDVYDGVAVAWIRREGATDRQRRRSDIVALYRVVGHAYGPVAPRDDVRRQDNGPTYVNEGNFSGTLSAPGSIRAADPGDVVIEIGHYVLIDWFDRSNLPDAEEAQLWEELRENHPGC